ncbi:hypothetical protein FLONG3_10568 [Fusarium longipes]|uniref:Uncharacterized protein n=1 Tax=Fusarium longipes TaxID=694270 RepID=A0A395RMQ5_9HYPO|nr:hypothetical protein FLONG3_10568 [Fusarium longipes]
MDVESLRVELTALVSQHFQIVATHSQRQDQCYKRSYQSFVYRHGDRKPLILVPRSSKEEWIPHVRRFASSLGRKLELAGREATGQKSITSITDSKLFPDTVLDEAHRRPLCLAVSGPKPLSPDMMQMSWWTTKIQHPDDKARRVNGIKALIACGQVDSLLRLALWPRIHPEQVSHMQDYQWSSLNNGWQSAIDKIVVILLFLGVTGAFPHELIEQSGYQYWAPVAFLSYKSPFTPYIEAFGDKIPSTEDERRQEIINCIEALCATQAFAMNSDCRINWEERIMDGFLYILGFEAWNRGREGEGYLGCDLNKTKTAKSIQRLGQAEEENDPIRNAEGHVKKPIDPLKLRDPKQELKPEPSEDEQREMDELAALESIEADYGRKRSTKYISRNR